MIDLLFLASANIFPLTFILKWDKYEFPSNTRFYDWSTKTKISL